MRHRMHLLLVVLSLIVAACGDDGGTETPGDGPTHEEAIAASEALVARWDDRLAFYAVITSFDLGYSAEQLIAHHARCTDPGAP